MFTLEPGDDVPLGLLDGHVMRNIDVLQLVRVEDNDELCLARFGGRHRKCGQESAVSGNVAMVTRKIYIL